MDSKLLLVHMITLIYRENQLSKLADYSVKLVEDALKTVRVTDATAMDGLGEDAISGMKTTLTWMLKNPVDKKFDKTEIMQHMRVNVGESESLQRAVKEGIDSDLQEPEIKKMVRSYQETLKTYLNKLYVKNIIRNAWMETHFPDKESHVDWAHYVKDFRKDLKPFENMIQTKKHKGLISDLDFKNPASVGDELRKTQADLSTEGIMRFGIQAINRMFGPQLGGRRGEMIVIGALQHQFKTGMSLTLMRGLCLFNAPYLRDLQRKPLILRISFENDVKQDTLWLYQSLKEKETGLAVDPAKVDPDEAANYVADRLQATGYHVKIRQYDPTEFTINDLIAVIEEFEMDGYEIHALFLDYLSMMSKKGCDNDGTIGSDIRSLFRRTRNYCAPKGIMVITPHQLSTEAKKLIRFGAAENFVADVANKGYFDGCGRLDQEVDFEMYIHKVEANDETFLTVQRGKHRKLGITRSADLHTVLKFGQIGAIADDLFERDSSRRFVGGDPLSSGGGPAWYT